jgi:hypothetical protein
MRPQVVHIATNLDIPVAFRPSASCCLATPYVITPSSQTTLIFAKQNRRVSGRLAAKRKRSESLFSLVCLVPASVVIVI